MTSWRWWLGGATLAALALAACGLARGDAWMGMSTGDRGPCPIFEFDLLIDGDKVGGTATSEFEWGTALWEVRGSIAPDNRITLQTRTPDPRAPQPVITWTGTYNVLLWDLTSTPDAPCPKARVARLQRR